MQNPSFGHLSYVFERLIERLPPLVPEPIVRDMMSARDHLRQNPFLPVAEAEATVLVFGKMTWPYRKAFEEFVTLSLGELGERYALDRMTVTLKKRYQEFLVYGGTFRDLCGGRPLIFFSGEERGLLCALIVEVHLAVRNFVYQKVLVGERVAYEAKIIEFRHILRDIEDRLTTLRHMADEEQEHPDLAAEIRAQVAAFEEGLCVLSEEVRYDAVCAAEEHFQGRKQEKRTRAHVHRV